MGAGLLAEKLRDEVLEANLDLVRRGLVISTFGNASAISRQDKMIAIKPSGVPYSDLQPEDIVLVDLAGKKIDGELNPSSDLGTHVLLYEKFPAIGGVVHTHSEYATIWAQSGLDIPAYGTTHADYFHGPVPCTDELTDAQIGGDYVFETGVAIVERLAGTDPLAMPAALVAGHAPFCWGVTVADAVNSADMLEFVARMAYRTATLRPDCAGVSQALLDRHYQRKHGATASYGQSRRKGAAS
jgi:L-ribulose-5-phosphate 4-epimerase